MATTFLSVEVFEKQVATFPIWQPPSSYGNHLPNMATTFLIRQSAEYKESVLPAAMKSKTTAAEAGVTAPWYKYADKVLGVDTFGLSAPGDQVFEAKGITVPKLVALAK